MTRVAVDVCIGRVGIARLRAAGHDVVAVAEPAEPDREWFARAVAAAVEVVISTDRDLSILCHDNRVAFFKAKPGHSGRATAEQFIQRYARRSP